MIGYAKYKLTDGTKIPASGIFVTVYNRIMDMQVEVKTDSGGGFYLKDEYLDDSKYQIRASADGATWDPDTQTVLIPYTTGQGVAQEQTEDIPNLPQATPVYPETELSGTNAMVYVYIPGRRPVELDIANIQFTLQRPKLPLYGYKSTYFDDVASGSVIAQGTFMLNTQKAGQLNKHLRGLGGEWRDMVPANFNIRMKYVRDYTGKVLTGYSLFNISILSTSTVSSPSGEPLMEQYSFISRNIRPYGNK